MTQRKWMKPGLVLLAVTAAISSALMAVDIGRILGRLEGRSGMRAVPVILWVICGLGTAFACLYLFQRIRSREKPAKAVVRESRRHEWVIYLCVILLVTLGLVFLYNDMDLGYPMLLSDGDEVGVYAMTKSIIRNGTSLITPQEGGAAGTDMFDYPYSDKLSFLFVRLIGFFVKNPYTVVSLFFFLNHYLAALAGVFVCRKLKIGEPMAVTVGVLYAFSPFIQLRFSHMWLTSYYLLPLACLMAVYVIEGKVFEDGGKIRDSLTFWKMAAVSYACAFTGLYYAYFTCALLAAAMVIHFFRAKERGVCRILYPSVLILFVAAGVVTNVVPNFVYWHMNGMNNGGEFSKRMANEAEYHGLKFTRLLLPRQNHRIPEFAKLAEYYDRTYPMNTENVTASLGLVAAIGFVAGIILLLAGREKYLSVTSLNMSLFLIGTTGGIGTLISVFVDLPVRSYNRVSIIIMFLSLVIVAMAAEIMITKHRRVLLPLACAALMLVGFFDQTRNWDIRPYYAGYEKMKNFVDRIEEQLEPGDSVFVLPFDGWPRSDVAGGYRLHYCYLESEDLIWSYGAMDGRQEAEWQAEVAGADPYDMIRNLRAGGYDGVFMDVDLMRNKFQNENHVMMTIEEITAALGEEPMASGDNLLLFWKIDEEKKLP